MVGTGGRSGVYLTTADRSRYVYFGQNTENNWQVNVNPGSPTGAGTALPIFGAALDALLDPGEHRIKMVADGSTVEVFLDGVSGGRFPFEVSSGIFVELGGFARGIFDSARAVFDDVQVDYLLPCVELSDSIVAMTIAEAPRPITVTIPKLLNDIAPATVTITSQNPGVAVPSGGANGALTLNFPAGAPNTLTFDVRSVGLGSATFNVTAGGNACVSSGLKVDVVAVPMELFSDTFDTSINMAEWVVDMNSFDLLAGGIATFESGITVQNGQARINVIAETGGWPGLALFTTDTYSPTATEPVTFEVDRTKLEFVLVTGTGAYQRSGVWVRDRSGNFVFFSENVAHNGRNFGWRYNKQTLSADDNPTGDGVNIPAFDGGNFDNQGSHRIKIVANGSSVKLFLDGILGAEVPFPNSQTLTFGLGTYVEAATDVATGYFDNVRILGGSVPVGGTMNVARQSDGSVVISWTGAGTLQQNDSASPAGWTDVTPAPAGSTYTIAPNSLVQKRFFRLR